MVSGCAFGKANSAVLSRIASLLEKLKINGNCSDTMLEKLGPVGWTKRGQCGAGRKT
jgi:hypothetical protein